MGSAGGIEGVKEKRVLPDQLCAGPSKNPFYAAEICPEPNNPSTLRGKGVVGVIGHKLWIGIRLNNGF